MAALPSASPITEFSGIWPKQKGIGAGVPTAFELVLGHQAGVVDRAIAVVALSVPFLYVAWKKTEGGWRWRKGDEDFDDEPRR